MCIYGNPVGEAWEMGQRGVWLREETGWHSKFQIKGESLDSSHGDGEKGGF